MRASIEQLTRLVPMTELFTDGGVRQRQDTDNITRARFNEVLSGTQMEDKTRAAGITRRKEEPSEPEKMEEEKDETETDENSIVGLYGQNSVVFILEGEKGEESQLRVEDAAVTITTESGAVTGEAELGQSEQFQVVAETIEEVPEVQDTQSGEMKPDVKADTNVKAETEVKADTNVKAETEVKADTNVKAETEVKADTNVKAETEVKADTNVKAETEVKADTDVKAETEVEADTNVKAETEVKADTNVKAEMEVKAQTNVTTETDEKAETVKVPETNVKAAKHEQSTKPENAVETKETDGPETMPVTEEKPETKNSAKPGTEHVTETEQTKSAEPVRTEKTDTKPAEQTEDTQPKTQTVTARDVKAAEKNAAEQTAGTVTAAQTKEDTAQKEIKDVPEKSGAAEAVVKPAGTAETEKADADSGEAMIDAAGKTMARTPETRTARQQEKQEAKKDFSENGEPCPLENENDEIPVEGKKTYKTSETTQKKDTEKEILQKPADGTSEQGITDITHEKFQSEAQIRAAVKTAQQTPVFKENLFEAMVERIDMMKTADTSQMSIRLNPDFLGEVTLNITMDAAGLHVKIGAGNREVSGMINAQINTLIETLSNKGIEVAKIEVAYSGVEHNNANNTPQEQQKQGQPGRSRRGLGGRRIESTAFYAVSALEEMSGYLDMGVSSVEYRA